MATWKKKRFRRVSHVQYLTVHKYAKLGNTLFGQNKNKKKIIVLSTNMYVL